MRADDLTRLRKLVDERTATRLAWVAKAGDESERLRRKRIATWMLGRLSFLAARPARAAELWRHHAALADREDEEIEARETAVAPRWRRLLERWIGPIGSDARLRARLSESSRDARRADGWRIGRMDLFADHVERVSRAEHSQANLRALCGVALDWRILGRRVNEQWWLEGIEELAAQSRLRAIKENHRGEQLIVAEALEADGRLALAWYWLGDHARAHAHVVAALTDSEAWAEGRLRLYSDETEDTRAELLRPLRAIEALTDPAGARPQAAVSELRAALLASLRTHETGEEEYPAFLHIVALAQAQPEAAEVAEFRAALPHLVHLLGPA